MKNNTYDYNVNNFINVQKCCNFLCGNFASI